MKLSETSIRRPVLATVMSLTILLFGGVPVAAAQDGSTSFQTLSPGQMLSGFRAVAVYLNDAEQPIGGRFIHARTSFTFDVLQIQSVPQGLIWVNSFPTSDRGEPHTQEHLLLGTGNKGRSLLASADMSLAGFSAFTLQWRTCYHFHTAAGPDVFYHLFESLADALLHPDYADEEIRREVRNFGVTENPKDRTLRLEEKGTVYNEIVSNSERPLRRLRRALSRILYGQKHPLSYDSGGWPAAMREMKPEHIRQFHRANYHLGNMGMVGSFPKEMRLEAVLRRANEIFNRLQPDSANQTGTVTSQAALPPPAMAPPGTIEIVEYPHKNEQQPGPFLFAWPPVMKFNTNEELLLLELFIESLAGDATTNLYKRFVDTQTRALDLGAKGVFGWVSSDPGHPVYVGLSDIPPVHISQEAIKTIRQTIMEEISRIASWQDGSPELAEFNGRLHARVVETRRDLSKLVNSPPGFGLRSFTFIQPERARRVGFSWMDHLDRLARFKGFRRPLTMKRDLAFLAKLLSGKQNFWRAYIAKWKLAETTPYAGVARPSPSLIGQEENDRQARIEAETTRLRTYYSVSDNQEALRRYRSDYDAETARLEELTKQAGRQRFVDAPPLTLDDQLAHRVSSLPGGITMVSANFDTMTSATIGIALRLDGVPETELMYLSILPALLTSVGVVQNGNPISSEKMSERLRQEILDLNAYFSTNFRTGRAELVVRGAGNDAREAQRALEWMKLVLMNPDWRPENLPRIRDVVDQSLSALRNTTQGREELWVGNPANAYRRQDSPLLLTTESFLTRAHNVHRLRWLLRDAGNLQEREAISTYFEKLAAAAKESGRADLRVLLDALHEDGSLRKKLAPQLKPYHDAFAGLPTCAKALVVEAAKDLEQLLTDIPDATLAADWAYLCGQMRHDLFVSPAKALGDLNSLRKRILTTGNARMFAVGSRPTQKRLEPSIRDLVAGLKTGSASAATYSNTALINSRLLERVPGATAPIFVGLVSPNMRGGVFLNSAPGVSYEDTNREALLQFLASNLYSGRGPHSIFMKTWGAGLAYRCFLTGRPGLGLVTYYAERTPELPQTLRFAIEELRKSPRDPALVEYAVAQAFLEFRSASSYEARGETMAADLADGVTPEVVNRFRKAILELREMPGLADELYNRTGDIFGKVLPGYGVKAKDVAGGVYFAIGPEKQLDLYEEYLKSVDGTEARLYRLYPRDYWMTLSSVIPERKEMEREERAEADEG